MELSSQSGDVLWGLRAQYFPKSILVNTGQDFGFYIVVSQTILKGIGLCCNVISFDVACRLMSDWVADWISTTRQVPCLFRTRSSAEGSKDLKQSPVI